MNNLSPNHTMMSEQQIESQLHFLPRVSAILDREIWIKRDDANGDLLTVGNKQRKLRYLLTDAMRKGADTVITTGGPNSNHARATAAMAIQLGLKPILVLGGQKQESKQGNYLLNHYMGVEVVFSGASTHKEMEQAVNQHAEKIKAEGLHPYVIGVGGSNGLGSLGYVDAYAEMKEQAAAQNVQFDWLFVSAGSGGTIAGLIYGCCLHKDATRIVGVSSGQTVTDIKAKIVSCLEEATAWKGDNQEVHLDDLPVYLHDEYIGEGYGCPTDGGMEALHLLASKEAILLDHVYTAKAMAGCIDYIRKEKVRPGEKVLFWHTGGTPGLFAING
ncbi:pyridoxal-phosphate dependent enzyme [Brevibacillus fluminis]|uniref:Pyridoxal-phosphate dependent enzyme n=1 Tax=Brevibacillus fluminis TaxID=511487 RepID=A0A3M8DPD5_9BACL|nr:pyridoxal-phosphate dependent enzyme [Brevibacillus fluminis]RNB89968.1 pyridoxal-phosphate dependent enzyme [Brevibacillus fluminis]